MDVTGHDRTFRDQEPEPLEKECADGKAFIVYSQTLVASILELHILESAPDCFGLCKDTEHDTSWLWKHI